jgi:hypothetical protein
MPNPLRHNPVIHGWFAPKSLRRWSSLEPTNQKVGSSSLSGRAIILNGFSPFFKNSKNPPWFHIDSLKSRKGISRFLLDFSFFLITAAKLYLGDSLSECLRHVEMMKYEQPEHLLLAVGALSVL